MLQNKTNTSIGFIGTGVMGKHMAANLIKAGFKVFVYTRTKSKAEDLLKQGAVWRDSIAEIAPNVNVIITMLGFPIDVEEIYLGERGVLNHAKSGTYLIDMTTSTPLLAKRIYKESLKKGLYALDAPVSGGDIGAQKGKLAIMVGGEPEVFETVKPIFNILGTNIRYQGEAGAGQHTKICNQISIAANIMGVSEAISYAQKAGLDPNNVLKSIESGAAGSWQLSNLGPKMIDKDFEPGFYIKHFIKDLDIALDEARQMNLNTPTVKLAKSLFEKLKDSGEENSGTQALIKLYNGL